MSETVFDVQKRIDPVFKIHGQPMIQPQFGESPAEFRQRSLCVAQHLLPDNHVWRGVDIRKQPERALGSIEKALVADRIAAFKEPVSRPEDGGKLRHVREFDHSNRPKDHFFGDPELCWGPFKCLARRATFTPGMGRGADSPQAMAAAERGRHEQGLAFAALARERAAAGMR